MADEKDKKDDKKDDKKEDKKDDKSAESADSGAEGAEGGAKPKKSKKKLFIIIGLVVVLLAGGGAAAFFTGMLGGGGGGGEHAEEEEAKNLQAVYYNMPEMIINLASPGKQASFLKATIIIEINNQLDAVTIENNLPRLMDAFNTYVRELRPSDLSGSAGITRLREELLLRANKALEPMKIKDVLFKEIVVQ